MTIYERGEDYNYHIEVRDDDGTLVDPAAIIISIYSPCGETLVGGAAMSKDTTGIYDYYYDIPEDAFYGKYRVVCQLTDSDGNIVKYTDYFYLFPWDINDDVRFIAGFEDDKSISDSALNKLIWNAYQEALDTVYQNYYNQTMLPNPDTGEWIDGTNTTFETKHSPIADANGDGVINGYGESSCGTDVDGWWKDEDGNCHRVKVTVNEAHCGNITVTQLDGTAIPSNAKWVHLNYSIEYPSYNENLFRQAIEYLAAHNAIIKFKALDKATLADLHSSTVRIIESQRNEILQKYKKIMRKIKRPNIEGGMIPGEN